jgi:NADH dehydrogenase [ubiquinone] 1 alpha subcomplex assembly factor 7
MSPLKQGRRLKQGQACKRDKGLALLRSLTRRIARDGPLTVAQYMEACLADPSYGYWQKAASIGAAGDFTTAPEISQIFGELIGLWCAVVWQGLGRPPCLRLVELGPGRGTSMRDALRAARTAPAFLDAASVHLIEASAPLRDVQRRTLLPPAQEGSRGNHPSPARAKAHAPAIVWHDTVAGVPPGPAIVIGNEFLDALPIRQLVFSRRGWHERVVAGDGRGGLRFAVGAKVAVGGSARETPQPGTILEVRDGEDALLEALARRFSPLVALFIDYGPEQEAFGDTLQAASRHAYVDPLQNPGAADLTAHVQFAALRRKACAAGLAADGPIPQAQFLGRLGIAERAARLMAANPQRAGEIESGVGRLLSPTGMGGLVKAMAVRSRHLPPPVAFL